jgi:hypothetical protein
MDLARTDRAVSQEEGQAMANEFGASFMEISVSNLLMDLNHYYSNSFCICC